MTDTWTMRRYSAASHRMKSLRQMRRWIITLTS
nr:MAG TPA: hypothetical protein [Caudoviricetes sp.]